MTNQQLREAHYDAVFNEGGEGFNPYRDSLEAITPPVQAPPDLAEQEYQIDRALERLGMDEHPDSVAKRRALRAELAEVKARRKALFLADWPLEITEERHEQWNRWWDQGGTAKEIAAFEAAAGWELRHLAKATKLHGLSPLRGLAR